MRSLYLQRNSILKRSPYAMGYFHFIFTFININYDNRFHFFPKILYCFAVKPFKFPSFIMIQLLFYFHHIYFESITSSRLQWCKRKINTWNDYGFGLHSQPKEFHFKWTISIVYNCNPDFFDSLKRIRQRVYVDNDTTSPSANLQNECSRSCKSAYYCCD